MLKNSTTQLVLIALYLLAVNTSQAQVQHNYLQQGISIKTNADAGTNFLRNGDFSLSQNNILTLNYIQFFYKKNNRAGIDATLGTYYQTKNKRNISWILGLEQTYLINANLSYDAAALLTYGNYYLANKTIHLGNSYAQYYNTEQLQLGATLHIADSTTHVQITTNIIGVKKYTEATIDYLDMYTAPYFTAISGNANWNVVKSDTSKNTARYKGYGATVNLNVYSTLHNSNITKVYYGLRNVGGIQLNQRTIALSKQGSFYYDGVTINGINDFKDTTLFTSTINKLKDSLFTASTSKYATQLPWNTYLAFDAKLYKKWSSHVGFSYQYSVAYKPMFFVQLMHTPNSWFSWGIANSYGGYSYYALGANAAFKFKKMNLYVAIKNVLPLKRFAANQGIQFGLNFGL
jgi:hypothetical protein